MITRQPWRRHRPNLQALQTEPAQPAQPVVWPAEMGVAKKTVYLGEVARAVLLANQLTAPRATPPRGLTGKPMAAAPPREPTAIRHGRNPTP